MVEDDDLLDELEVFLVFLCALLGKVIGFSGLWLWIEGYGMVEVVDGRRYGVLMRNLVAGWCWVEVEYGGE